MLGKLSIVATPIGNLEDITLRALRVLKEADTILCEDTRVTKKLLAHYDIDVTVKRCDAEKEMDCARFAETLLADGKHVAYVSDAGTLGVSDPGARLVGYIREQLPDVTIEAIPGPSALTAALSVAGVQANTFTFFGFVPHKKGRQTFFKTVAEHEHVSVFFESPHRIMRTLTNLAENLDADATVTVCRELTKLHEEVFSGTPHTVHEHFLEHADHQRGEFILIVS